MQGFVDRAVSVRSGEARGSLAESGESIGASTSEPSGARWKRSLFALYLLFVGTRSIRTGATQARFIDPWINGDWLINYSGGFVRRGLPGELAMLLHHVTKVPLHWVVLGIQSCVLIGFLVAVFKLTEGIRWSFLMAAILLSPATLAFTVLDPQDAGLRKDLLLFAALAITIWTLVRGRWKDWQIGILLGVFLVGLALSHEGLLVAGPYFFAVVVIQHKSVRRAVRICAAPFALAAIALVAVVLHHGDQATAQAICSSAGGTQGLGTPSLLHITGGFCGGAISWLQLNVTQERGIIAPMIRQWHLPRLFATLAIPTFLPLVALMYLYYLRDHLRYEVLTAAVCASISIAGTALLFYVGLDWGRWVHLQAICLMLVLLMLDLRAVAANAKPAKPRSVRCRVTAIIALFLYATIWTLPGVGYQGETPGYVPFVWKSYRNSEHQLRVSITRGRVL